jgi:hypothetical protein
MLCYLFGGQWASNMSKTEQFVDQEVRIRLLEDIASKIDSQFETMNAKIDEKFKAQRNFIGLVISVIVLPVALHHYGLI